MPLKDLECQASKSVNSDACPRPTTDHRHVQDVLQPLDRVLTPPARARWREAPNGRACLRTLGVSDGTIDTGVCHTIVARAGQLRAARAPRSVAPRKAGVFEAEADAGKIRSRKAENMPWRCAGSIGGQGEGAEEGRAGSRGGQGCAHCWPSGFAMPRTTASRCADSGSWFVTCSPGRRSSF